MELVRHGSRVNYRPWTCPFPPPPLVNQTTGDYLWPALSRRERGKAGLFHARRKGQEGTRDDFLSPDSDTSGDTSAKTQVIGVDSVQR